MLRFIFLLPFHPQNTTNRSSSVWHSRTPLSCSGPTVAIRAGPSSSPCRTRSSSTCCSTTSTRNRTARKKPSPPQSLPPIAPPPSSRSKTITRQRLPARSCEGCHHRLHTTDLQQVFNVTETQHNPIDDLAGTITPDGKLATNLHAAATPRPRLVRYAAAPYHWTEQCSVLLKPYLERTHDD